MKRYVALLRGINVGGKRLVPMETLKKCFESLGFLHVTTYINSGNVLFVSDLKPDTIQSMCQKACTETFQITIDISIVEASTLCQTLEHVPAWWGQDPYAKHQCIFVIEPFQAEDVVKALGDLDDAIELIYVEQSMIFWTAPITFFSKSKMFRYVSKNNTSHLTIRNANTTKKLCSLLHKLPIHD